MDAAVAGLANLEALEPHRQALFKVLGSPAGRVLLRPFLPRGAEEDVLANVFTNALSVRDAGSGEEVGTAYRALLESSQSVDELVDEFSTAYARRVLSGVVDALRTAARHRLELKSPPARLVFSSPDRPMPLLEPGVTCDVQLTVTNDGASVADDIEVFADIAIASVATAEQPLRLGRLEPDSRRDLTVPLLIEQPATTADLILQATWTNRDHTVGRAETTVSLQAHEVHIDWPSLETQEPYAPYPVDRPDHLVGRERHLQTLINYFSNRPLANLYVTGQRRVGKTSLIRVLIQALAADGQIVVAAVEMGEVRAGGAGTVGALGRKLAERLVRNAGLEDDIHVPPFEDSLAPLTDVVEQIGEWDEELSFLFVIDEFDELPHETYRRDGPGDALFVPMRSLAQKPNVGWLLVGGEKMPFIRDEQASRLNTFREVPVDYLMLGNVDDTRGFGGLVRQPLPTGFAVDESAIRSIFALSAGNPHFAKEICASMFTRAVARRDAVVGASEVHDAMEAAARERDVELFAHSGRTESSKSRRNVGDASFSGDHF